MPSIRTSYNGWPVITPSTHPSLVVIEPVASVRLRVERDCAPIFAELARRWHALVEPIDQGVIDDWGYAYRTTTGASSWSCHASGTAVDINATKHPWQTTATRTFTAGQIAAMRRILADLPVLKWLDGHDPMHVEIRKGVTRAEVQALAAKLAGLTPSPPDALPPSPRPSVPTVVPRPIDWRTPPADLVEVIQRIVGVKPDRVYGRQTTAGVSALQRRLKIGVDGRFGPATAEAWLLSRPMAREGSRGTAVRLIQWIGQTTVDGRFGPKTGRAVEGMQQWAGLTVDALVGPATKRAITR